MDDGNCEIATFGRYLHDADMERIYMEAEKHEKDREEKHAGSTATNDTEFAKMKVLVEVLLAAKKYTKSFAPHHPSTCLH